MKNFPTRFCQFSSLRMAMARGRGPLRTRMPTFPRVRPTQQLSMCLVSQLPGMGNMGWTRSNFFELSWSYLMIFLIGQNIWLRAQRVSVLSFFGLVGGIWT